MKKIIIIRPQYMYCRQWAIEFEKAFDLLGYRAVLIDPRAADFTEQVTRAVDTSCLFFLGWAEDGFQWKNGEQNLFDSLGIPLVNILIDHLEYNFGAIVSAPIWEARHFLCGLYDQDDARLATRDFRMERVKFFFMPNFGTRVEAFDRAQEQREYTVSFCGKIPNYNTIRRKLSAPMAEVADQMIEILCADETKTPLDALESVELKTPIQIYEALFLLMNTSQYVRGLRRKKLLKALAKKGIVVDMFCTREEFEFVGEQGFRHHSGIPYEDYLRMMTQSQIILNTSPLSRWAITDRVLNAMANGAVALTDSNALMADCLEDRKDIFTFSHQDYTDAADLAVELIQNSALRQETASNAYNTFLGAHTVLHRAEYLVDLVQNVDFSKE